ncbi:hypothetical protein Q7A53_10120 [Halobacillus rhizosphaerae]|uniref:hypothetical protein n=1 Tax=Halobacillus rhizosphaerae TaxID=3064889 RepID=UPI00398B9B83
MKRILLLSAVLLFFFLSTGCSNTNTLNITDQSKVVLIPDGKGGQALTFSTFIKNHSPKSSEPFYIEFEINSSQLQSKLETSKSKMIVGENTSGNAPGEIYEVKPHTVLQAGSTIRVEGKGEEVALEKLITQSNAVKVRLLNKEHKIITSSSITSFGKDLTADGIDNS